MVTVGIDEVGRGCWAGPLVAGAVILSRPMRGLRDSKQLTKARREVLAARIQKQALSYGLGWVSAREIDELGLTLATTLAMRRALGSLTAGYDEIIIDGNLNFLSDNPKARTMIKADDSVPVVSAASILAKVARDGYMADAANEYPEYGFTSHVGYGTKLHMERLMLYGVR